MRYSYENRIVVFLDILGFQEVINKTVRSDGSDNTSEIQNLVDAFNSMRYFAEPLYLDENSPELDKSKNITQFSDSLVISFPLNVESGIFWTLLDLRWIIINLINRGLICRGAITYGKLLHTDRYLFGPALNDAYNLERQSAVYPRVILSENLIKVGKKYHSKHHNRQREEKFIRKLISLDQDGWYYIDYFNVMDDLDDPEYDYPCYLKNLSKVITEGLKHKDLNIKAKYQWMAEKYNETVTNIRKNLEDIDFNPELKKLYYNLPTFLQ